MADRAEQATSVSDDWVRRYLTFLGVEFATPDYAALMDLTAAHRRAVTFENITAILRRQSYPGQPVPPVDPEGMLCAWEEGAGGGVCFEIAGMLNRLLTELGYQTQLILARGSLGFLGGHQAVVVELNDQRYLVEVSGTMPVFEPVSLMERVEIRRAGSTLRFRPDDVVDGWVAERRHDDVWQPVFQYDLRVRDEQVQEAAYQRHHTVGQSWVVDTVVLARIAEEEIYTLRHGELVHATAGGRHTQPITEPAEYARLAREIFRLPRLSILEGLQALAERDEERL